mmetsp:Transcript_25357/g.59748  ORF Transcript_25357/g.59748 Transcript_25357/m.59748 type:complete len:390 (+) Transcript_25357:1345-2514(+)
MEDLQSVHHALDLLARDSGIHSRREELFAGRGLDLGNSVFRFVRHGHERTVRVLGQGFDHFFLFRIECLPGLFVDLVDDEDELFVCKQGFDAAEQRALLLDGVPTVLGNITKVQDTAGQVGKSNNGLHFNGVSLFQGMIQDSRRIDNLPAQVLVVAVTNKQRFGGKGIRLDIDVATGDFVHETRLSYVGQAAHEDRSGVRIQCGKTRKMFSDFFQIRQRRLLSLQDGAHSSQRRSLEALATVGGIGVFDHPNHVPSDLIDERTSRVELSQSEFVVIPVVQGVAKIGIEGMDVVEPRKVGQDGCQSLGNCLLSKFDLPHVEGTDSGNLVPGVDNSWGTTLRSHENNVDQVRRRRHRTHFLKVVDGHGGCLLRCVVLRCDLFCSFLSILSF